MSAWWRVATVFSLGTLLSACALPYYWQAVGGQIGLLRKRVPIESVIADPDYDEEIRARLQVVNDLREFAVTELALPENDSYTSFVDLGRPYVVWNVIATEEFSTEPMRWCFPVAGCVAYRGYFDRAAAERFQGKLEERGLDTYSGGSGAYSTLGYFDDPILSTMLGGEQQVAGILFHELAHQRVYIKGDTELSEAYASAVEEYGVELWLTLRDDLTALADYRQRRRRGREFADLIATERASLAALYGQGLAVEDVRAAKARSFDEMRARYAELKRSWGGVSEFDGWFGGNLNNAVLVAVSNYRQWLPGLRWRLERVGIAAFHDEIDALAGMTPAERAQRLTAWNEASAAGSQAQLRQVIGGGHQVSRSDRLQPLRLDAERGESVLAADARHGHRAQIVE